MTRKGSCRCIHLGIGVRRSIEIVFSILFSLIVIMRNDTMMIRKGPCIFDVTLL